MANKNVVLDIPEGSKKGSVKWKSPSNIALVKYWGKYGNQLPKNPSISFTLEESHTITTIDYQVNEAFKELIIDFYFNGELNQQFGDRVLKFLKSVSTKIAFLSKSHLVIHSENSFPHSAGIASSASGMSALVLCICSIEKELSGSLYKFGFYKRASFFSRLASGSACRSIFPEAVVWGKISGLNSTSNEFASPLPFKLHDFFNNFQNSILIVDEGQKQVTSRAGHGLMENHPYAKARYGQARKNFDLLLKSLQTGDFKGFIEIVENEALSLHSLMMSSNPGFFLIKPNTIIVIEKIRELREQKGLQICFTLDAGPNIHLLYPAKISNEMRTLINIEFINKGLIKNCIFDRLGKGPLSLK